MKQTYLKGFEPIEIEIYDVITLDNDINSPLIEFKVRIKRR